MVSDEIQRAIDAARTVDFDSITAATQGIDQHALNALDAFNMKSGQSAIDQLAAVSAAVAAQQIDFKKIEAIAGNNESNIDQALAQIKANENIDNLLSSQATLEAISNAAKIPDLSSLNSIQHLHKAAEAAAGYENFRADIYDLDTTTRLAGLHEKMTSPDSEASLIAGSLDYSHPQLRRGYLDVARRKQDIANDIESFAKVALTSDPDAASVVVSEEFVMRQEERAEQIDREKQQLDLLAEIAGQVADANDQDDSRHKSIRWWIYAGPVLAVFIFVLNCDSQADRDRAQIKAEQRTLEVLEEIRDRLPSAMEDAQ